LDVNVAVVNACVSRPKQKCGKAAGYDGLSAEHVINAHPLLSVLLSLLFRMILQQRIVPTAFGKGIVIPLVKTIDGNRTDSSNYRGITLSPVISKLFELVIMDQGIS